MNLTQMQVLLLELLLLLLLLLQLLKTNDKNYVMKSINAGIYPQNLKECLKIKNEFKNETNDGVLHPSCVRGITAVSKETRSGREDVRSNL